MPGRRVRYILTRAQAGAVSLLRPILVQDWLFLCSLLWLAVGLALARLDRATYAPLFLSVGWAAFAGFWGLQGGRYLLEARYVLGTISAVTGALAGYAGLLSARRDPVGVGLTTVFVVAGLLFVPLQFLDPVYETAVATVAGQTVALLSLFDLPVRAGLGPEGVEHALLVPTGDGLVAFRIISACTGVSAVALFAGVVAAAPLSLRRRAGVALAVGALVYVLNLVRNAFVAAATACGWFDAAAPLVRALWKPSAVQGGLTSYYVAEYLVSPLLVVVVLAGVYLALVRAEPTVGALPGLVLETARRDVARLTG